MKTVMATFFIYEDEVTQHCFTVEADSKEDALKKHEDGESQFSWSEASGNDVSFIEEKEEE